MALQKTITIESVTLEGGVLTMTRDGGVSNDWRSKQEFKNSVQAAFDRVVSDLALLGIAHHLKTDSNLDNVAVLTGMVIEIDVRPSAGNVLVRIQP